MHSGMTVTRLWQGYQHGEEGTMSTMPSVWQITTLQNESLQVTWQSCLRWVLLKLLSLFSKSPHIKLGIRDEYFQTLFFSRTSIPQTETQHFVSLPPFHAPSVLSITQLSPVICQLCLLFFTTEHIWEAKQPSEQKNRHQDFLLFAFIWFSFKKTPILWPIC